MSFFRNLFESKPAQTDQEYTISLVDQLLDDKASPYLITNLKEFSQQYPDEISSRGIPALINAFTKFSENEDVIKDLITIFADLLRSENDKKEENAKTFLQCDDTIPNFVRALDNKNPQVRVGSMHVLMMIANLQPTLFTETLTSHQPQMIRLFGSISDKNEQISSRFVNSIPKMVENNPDFQQIVGFYAFEALVNSISRERPEFLDALISVLKDNQINQSLFINSGYLSIIENMIKTPDEKILNLMLLLFDPHKNSINIESFRKSLESTNIVNILCDNIVRNVYRPLNVHLLSICIKGNKNLTDQTKEKVSTFVRLTLETRKSATVNNGNNSFLDGIDLFGEFFESFVFESEENSHFLNSTIINGQNLGFDSLTESYLNLCTFSVLISPNCKSDFENVFNSLISNIKRYETVISMFKFFVCFCWQSKESCDLISEEEKMTILIQILIDDKNGNNNGYFIPNSNLNSNEKKIHYLSLLLAEIILFSGKNRAKIGSIVNTTVLPYELEKSLIQSDNSEFTDNSKFSQLEKQIVSYINDHHLSDSLKQFKNEQENSQDQIDLNEGDDNFYQTEYSRLLKENKELKTKIIENEDNLNKIKNENVEKNRQIDSLSSKIDEYKSKARNGGQEEDNVSSLEATSREIQLNNEGENADLNNIIKDLQNENQSIKELNNQLAKENEQIKENLNALQKQNSELLEKVQNIENITNENTNNENTNNENTNNESLNNESLNNESLNNDDLNDGLKNELESKIEDLMSQISELKTQLEDKNAILENEENSKLQLRGQIQDLSMQLAESNNNNESLQEQNRTSSNELSQLRSSLEDAKNITEDFQKQLSEKNDSITSLKSQNEQLRNKIEKNSIETTELIEKYNKEISDLRSQQSLVGGDLISSLNSQIEELKNESSHQKIEFENEKEILRQNISKLQSENSKLEVDCNSLLDVKMKLQEEGKKHENDELILTSKNDELQRQLNEIEQINSQKVEALKLTFEAEKEKMKIENESLKNQLDKFNQNDQFNSNEVESLRKQINDLKTTTLPLTEVEQIRKENVELTKKISELSKQIDSIQKVDDTEKLNEENNIVELLRIKVAELENQLKQSDENIAEKDEMIQSLNSQVKEEKKKQKLNDKLAEELSKANQGLLDQVTQMQKQIEEFQLLFALNSPASGMKPKNEKQVMQTSSKVTAKTIEKKSNTKSATESESNNAALKSYEEQIHKLNSKINGLQTENKSLHDQLSQLLNKASLYNIEEEEEEDQKESLKQSLHVQLKGSANVKSSIYNLEEEEEEQNETLKQQIEHLNSNINELKLENQDLHTQLDHLLKNSNKNSNNNLEDEQKEQIEQLNSKVNDLQNENQSLHDQLKESSSNKNSNNNLEKLLKNQIENLSSKVNDLQNENKSLRDQLEEPSKMKSSISDLEEPLRQQIEQLNKKLQKQSIKMTELRSESESKAFLVKSLKEQNDELSNAMNSLQNENDLLQLQLNKKPKSAASNEEEEEEEEADKKVVKELKQQVAQMKAKIASLEEQNRRIQQQNSDSFSESTTKSNYEAIIAKQRKLIDSLSAQNKKLEAESVSANSNVVELTSQNENLRSEMKSRAAEFKRSSQESADMIKELKKKLEKQETATKAKSKVKSIEAVQPKSTGKTTEKSIEKVDNGLIEKVHSDKETVDLLNEKIKKLQSQNESLMAENNQLKKSPSKALVDALKEDKSNLEAKVTFLQEELDLSKKEMKKLRKKLKKGEFDLDDHNDDNSNLLNEIPISPITSKTAKRVSKSSKPSHRSSRAQLEDDRSKLLTEIEFLKRDNENQSQTITDLQQMLANQSFGSDSQGYVPNVGGYHCHLSSFNDDEKGLNIENEVLSSKLREMKEIERENRNLHKENMELKKLIRNRNGNSFNQPEIAQPREAVIMADENQQKKALRVIGKLWLDQKQQKINM